MEPSGSEDAPASKEQARFVQDLVKDAVGGWFTYEADDLDAAIAIAATVPAARMGGAVEIRPAREWG